MKLLCCLFLTLLIAVVVQSQNCNKLSSELFFTSLQFGATVPGDFIECSKNETLQYANYTDYRLEYNNLNNMCEKKYSDLFKFQSIPFSYALISANKKGQIFQVELYYFFEDVHGNDSIISPAPFNFTKLLNKLVSLFGSPTKTVKSPESDTLFIKELGVRQLVVWECKNIILQLRVNYGSRTKEMNILDVQIKNTGFELLEQIEFLH